MSRIFSALALTLIATAAPAQTDNAGGWALVSVGGVAAEPGARIAFSADGAVFGNTGCNRFSGQAVSAPGVLTFDKPFAVTKMACPEPKMTQEMEMLEALKGTVAVAYDPVADRMMLIPASGAGALGFDRDD